MTQYQINAPYPTLSKIKNDLWKQGKISSSLGGSSLVINIQDNGQLILLQDICNEYDVRYNHFKKNLTHVSNCR